MKKYLAFILLLVFASCEKQEAEQPPKPHVYVYGQSDTSTVWYVRFTERENETNVPVLDKSLRFEGRTLSYRHETFDNTYVGVRVESDHVIKDFRVSGLTEVEYITDEPKLKFLVGQ